MRGGEELAGALGEGVEWSVKLKGMESFGEVSGELVDERLEGTRLEPRCTESWCKKRVCVEQNAESAKTGKLIYQRA